MNKFNISEEEIRKNFRENSSISEKEVSKIFTFIYLFLKPIDFVIPKRGATCNHKSIRINKNISVCLKCGRMKEKRGPFTIFKYINGAIYSIKRTKK